MHFPLNAECFCQLFTMMNSCISKATLEEIR